MSEPERIQLSRKRGFRLQETSRAINGLDAVKVDRSTRYGNPLHADMWRGYTATHAVADFRRWLMRENQVASFNLSFGQPPDVSPLRGKNLACWCKPGAPCHANVLLEIANANDGGRAAGED